MSTLRATPSLRERFWAKVDKTATCWLWVAGKDSKGYGTFWIGDATRGAHRVSYELTHGTIPAGLELDHLCRVRNCVNPDHLEPVTHIVNTRRSPFVISTVNSTKTHCLRGHLFDEANTYITPRGTRNCRECKRAAGRVWERTRRAKP